MGKGVIDHLNSHGVSIRYISVDESSHWVRKKKRSRLTGSCRSPQSRRGFCRPQELRSRADHLRLLLPRTILSRSIRRNPVQWMIRVYQRVRLYIHIRPMSRLPFPQWAAAHSMHAPYWVPTINSPKKYICLFAIFKLEILLMLNREGLDKLHYLEHWGSMHRRRGLWDTKARQYFYSRGGKRRDWEKT